MASGDVVLDPAMFALKIDDHRTSVFCLCGQYIYFVLLDLYCTFELHRTTLSGVIFSGVWEAEKHCIPHAQKVETTTDRTARE